MDSPRTPTHRDAAVTPLWAVCGLTFLCSLGTGVVWAGVPFIAKHQYGFSRQSTLLLFLALGVTYVLGALSTGLALARVERLLSPRGALAMILTLSAAASAALLLTRAAWMLWVVAIAINVLSSWLWPIIESYLTAGRHGRDMRSAIGVWNVTWTGAVLASLLLMAPLVANHAGTALKATAIVYLFGLGLLPAFARRPAEHGAAGNGEVVAPDYPHLLVAARWLLLASYVLNSAISPLLPFLIAGLGVPAGWATTVAATWTAARVATVGLMWRAEFWHGRWGTLLLGGLTMIAGFALIVASASVPVIIVGLTTLGGGMGVTYYAALYYAMSVGHAEVDASAKHEALIGLGYSAGPTAGLIGLSLEHRMADSPFGPDGGVLICVSVLVAGAAALAFRRFVIARRGAP